MTGLERLLLDIRACRLCSGRLPHDPRPVVRASAGARILVAGQAPGRRVHESGLPFDDASGERLRNWMGVERTEFYDETRIAVAAMGFCYPGTVKGADLPPRPECAAKWRALLLEELTQVRLTLLVGTHAQRWHLGKHAKPTLSETVAAWRDYLPGMFVLPHPSWRNTHWLRQRPWFEEELIPDLRVRVAALL